MRTHQPEPWQVLSRKIVAAVEAEADALASCVADAVRVPSITGHEAEIAAFFADRLADEGLDVAVKRIPDAFAARHPRLRGATPLEARPNVFATLAADAPERPPLVLNGHTDVVPAGQEAEWSHAPFGGERANGHVWGRGSADMKGGLVAGAFALRALRAAGVRLACDVQLQCVIGEEAGGLGTLAALESEPRPGAAIVLEATECRVAPACGGAVIFDIGAEGRRAHTGLAWLGVSAMEKLALVYGGLRELAEERERRLDHPLFTDLPTKAPFGVGTFNAGEWIAMIPASASMTGRLGVLPGEDLEEVREELVRTVERVCDHDAWLRVHPATIRWPNHGFAAWQTPLDHPVVTALTEALTDLAADPAPRGMTYASDAGHFASASVPVVIFGPGSMTTAHLPDEHVAEEQLLLATKALALAIAGYAAR
jgi:acetylornithine deacetylase